tara:strand:+ start:158 stop:940 length:783 start_codon:yes stop_codon:yes gene_type:complete
MKIKNNKCFECDSDKNIVHHHVVPKSLGGTKTIPLCEDCHGLVHNKNLTHMNELRLKKQRKIAEEGFFPIGACPFGYRIKGSQGKKVLEIHSKEAEIVSYIFKKTHELVEQNLYSKTMITQTVLKSLKQKGYTRAGGVDFKLHNLRHILRNRTYIGKFTYKKKLYPHSFGNLVDENVFESIQTWRAGPDGVPKGAEKFNEELRKNIDKRARRKRYKDNIEIERERSKKYYRRKILRTEGREVFDQKSSEYSKYMSDKKKQ